MTKCNFLKNNFSGFEVQNPILDISKNVQKSKGPFRSVKNPKKRLVSIMLSFPKKGENSCDANFFINNAENYLGKYKV